VASPHSAKVATIGALTGAPTAWQQTGWALLVALPSLPVCMRLLGAVGGVLGCACGWLAIIAAQRCSADRPTTLPARRDARVLTTAVMLIAVAIAFAILFPKLNGQLPGQGSDRDDALNIAVAALLRGEYPYLQPTYLGNPVTPLPGALLLAAPFVVLGNAALQALAWPALWSAAMLAAKRSWRTVMAVAVVLLSPEALRETLTGGDLLANGVYIALAIWLLLRTASFAAPAAWRVSLAILLLGVTLASRPNFLLLLPIITVAFGRSAGAMRAVLWVGAAGAVALVLALPFYLYAPEAFTPLHVSRKLHLSGVAWSSSLLIGASVALALVLAWRSHAQRVFYDCALMCSLPFVLHALVDSLGSGCLEVQSLGYALCALPFAGLAMAQVDAAVDPQAAGRER